MATTDTFNFTGAEQQFTVPAGLTELDVDLRGAEGGGTNPGLGGRIVGVLPVAGGEILYIYVGGQGGLGNNSGGFNGGGDGQYREGTIYTNFNASSGGGGGASDVRRGGNTLADRDAVAGGGGGEGDADASSETDTGVGGDGGADTGQDGGDTSTTNTVANGGQGGTQSAGGSGGSATNGSAGQDGSSGDGGDGASSAAGDEAAAGGGGGAGYHGGGGAAAATSGSQAAGGGGAGGANYDDPLSSVTTNARGVRSGDGLVELTYETDNSPQNPAAAGVDGDTSRLTLSWDPPGPSEFETPAQYKIYRSTTAGVTTADTLAGTTPDGTTTTFTDTGLDEATEYFYIIVADFPNGGDGQASTEVSAHTAPNPPEALTEVSHDATSVDVSWDPGSTGADGYRLYASTDGGETYTQNGGDIAAGTTTGTFSGLRNGEEYTLAVRAFAGTTESLNDVEVLADDAGVVTETSPTRTVFSTAIRGSYTTQEP